MKRLMWMSVLLIGVVPLAWGVTNLYKLRNGASVTVMGAELIQSTNMLCNEFARLKLHFLAMTQQRDDSTTYDTVAVQWGVLDSSTNAPSGTVAQAMYDELNSFISNAGPSLEQWCSRLRQ